MESPTNHSNPLQGVWAKRYQIKSEIQSAQHDLDDATQEAKRLRKNNGDKARQQAAAKDARVLATHWALVSTEKNPKKRTNAELVPRPPAKKQREQNEARWSPTQAFQFACALAVTGAMAHCDTDTKSSDKVTVCVETNAGLVNVNVTRNVDLQNLTQELSRELKRKIPDSVHLTCNKMKLQNHHVLDAGDKLAFTGHGRGGGRDFSIVWYPSKTHIAAPILLKEENYDGSSKDMHVACMAFVRKTKKRIKHVILAEWVKTGFQVQGDQVDYYGYFDNPEQRWTCEVINGKLGNICDEEGKPVHVVHFDQIDKILNLNDDCAEVSVKQSPSNIHMQLHCLRTPGFFHVNGDPESDYSYIDFAGQSTGESSEEVYTRLQQQLVRLDSPSSHTTPESESEESESEESEQPEEPLYTLVPGRFKPTARYLAFHSITGLVAIGDGKFQCRFRKTPNGCLNTGSYTEECIRAKFDLNSIAKLEKEKAHPTILQNPPAAAAKPIASPEPHAKIIEIEAHEQDPHKFTVWYGVEDQHTHRMSIVVKSTDGDIDLPVIVGYVWDDHSREKFREFWTQHQSVEKKNPNIPKVPEQAKKPEVINLCESDGEEDSQKPPAPAATAKRPASPQPEEEPVSKRPGRKAADEQSGRDRSTGLSSGREWSLFGSQPTQPDVIQPGDSTSNNDIGQSPELDEPLERTTNPNNFGLDPADIPKHCGLCLNSDEVLSALGRNGRFKVMTHPEVVNKVYSNGTAISSIRVFIRVSTDKPGKTRVLTFGTIRRINKDGLADFFKHWLTQNCCKELVDAYWALSEHVDSDIEGQSERSGYDGDDEEMTTVRACPGLQEDNGYSPDPSIHSFGRVAENHDGIEPPDSPDIPATPNSSNCDFTSRLYQLPDTFEETQHALIGVKRKRDDLDKEEFRLIWRLREFAIVRIQKFFRRHSARTKVKRMRAEHWNAMDERAAEISRNQEDLVMKGQQQAKRQRWNILDEYAATISRNQEIEVMQGRQEMRNQAEAYQKQAEEIMRRLNQCK